MIPFPRLRLLPASLAFLTATAAGLVVAPAHAGTSCDSDSACPKGFTCQVAGSSGGCASTACAPGTDCPPPPPCEVTEIKQCMPGPCNADSDCATGMKCYSHTEGDCSVSVPPCQAGADCPPPPEPECTTKTIQQCVPQYVLPCTTAADCGEGFTCHTSNDVECAGSGGAAVDAGSATPAPDPGTPTPTPNTPPDQGGGSGSGSGCTTTTYTRCEPVVKTCAADSDCPASWTCIEMNRGGSSCSGTAKPLPDGGVIVTTDCTPPEPAEKVCVPPYYDLVSRGADDISAGDPQTGGTAGAEVPRGDTQGTTGDTKGGSTSGPGADHSSDSNTPPPSGESTNGVRDRAQDDGGCQMSAGHAGSSGASLLAALGLTALLRRRRQRAA